MELIVGKNWGTSSQIPLFANARIVYNIRVTKMISNDTALLLAISAMLLIGIGMIVVSFVPYPRVRLRRHSRRFFRLAGIGISILCLLAMFA